MTYVLACLAIWMIGACVNAAAFLWLPSLVLNNWAFGPARLGSINFSLGLSLAGLAIAGLLSLLQCRLGQEHHHPYRYWRALLTGLISYLLLMLALVLWLSAQPGGLHCHGGFWHCLQRGATGWLLISGYGALFNSANLLVTVPGVLWLWHRVILQYHQTPAEKPLGFLKKF